MSLARLERTALCDLFLEVGPDQPTLCAGWTTRDLAAHLVVRERRPDAAAGILVKPLAGYLERVRVAAAQRPFPELVEVLRHPPPWSAGAIGPLDRATNTMEFFIHHEDVRRAGLRRFPAGVSIVAPGYGESHAGRGPAQLTLTGDPGELALFLSGRQPVARVELTGPEELTEKLRGARLGI